MYESHRLAKRLHFSFEMMNKIFGFITEIDRLNTVIQITEKLSHQTIKKLTHSVLITSSGASNRIEGNILTDQEIELLYKDMRVNKLKTRDQQEVVGYLELLELVFQKYATMHFNEGLILQIHDMLLQYTSKDQGHRGKYKFGPNRVEARDREGNVIKIIFNPTEPALTPIEMHDLIDWTNNAFEKKEIHPLIVIGNFLFEYLAIHPFQDGNGRTSRILTNLLLLQQGYFFTPFASHESIIESRKAEYYLALNKTQNTWKTDREDITPWLVFFLESVKLQAEKAVTLSQKEDVEHYLSEIQLCVLNYINTHHHCSRQEIIKNTNISESTVKQAIKKLIDMKKIERLGSTRDVRYQRIVNST